MTDREGRSAPDVYGVELGQETCARCGHTAPTCELCGEEHLILGGRINGQAYCHTFVDNHPSCHTLTAREV